MNLPEAMKLANSTGKRIKRMTWSNYLATNVAAQSMRPDDIISDDWVVEDDILTISLTDLKQKLKILKPQDQQAVLAALGVTIMTKAE